MTPLQNKIEEAKKRLDKAFYDTIGLEIDPDGVDGMYLIRDEYGTVINGIDFSDERAELLKAFEQELSSIATLAQEEARKHERQCFENGMSSIKDLQHRCPQCGKETQTKMSYLESYNIGALWGRCFECAESGKSLSNNTQL